MNDTSNKYKDTHGYCTDVANITHIECFYSLYCLDRNVIKERMKQLFSLNETIIVGIG